MGGTAASPVQERPVYDQTADHFMMDTPPNIRPVKDGDSDNDSLLGDQGAYVPKPTPKQLENPPERQRKKPGPKPGPKSLLMKNDLGAKKEVIKEIEGFWGKGFIRKFIPQQHRPLTKRPKGTTRAIPRYPENDPKKWKPSVLKAIRSLAEKNQDKSMMRKMMSDIVRYRNRHTGNKKPELVTTDFDIIEDILDRGWTIKQSFEIRYKHLFQNGGKGVPLEDDDEDSDSEEMALEGADDFSSGFRKHGSDDGSSDDEPEYIRVGKGIYYPEPEDDESEFKLPKKEKRAMAQKPLPPFKPQQILTQPDLNGGMNGQQQYMYPGIQNQQMYGGAAPDQQRQMYNGGMSTQQRPMYGGMSEQQQQIYHRMLNQGHGQYGMQYPPPHMQPIQSAYGDQDEFPRPPSSARSMHSAFGQPVPRGFQNMHQPSPSMPNMRQRRQPSYQESVYAPNRDTSVSLDPHANPNEAAERETRAVVGCGAGSQGFEA
ncbi:hypothetical protein EJ04DRAFT_182999 [Polyplosphaeria fusca]|uniref:Uncharacterized protein n=1 Tax=Polyplosphaeria fusca TaxID=682080 RepID=A0A9P4QZS5_9PLEO|nr:hypothetical protein EJ04DRAFT_182999 [Polyplosphaeria fusca]